jgi:methanogenic corrinoid protein MtbC1
MLQAYAQAGQAASAAASDDVPIRTVELLAAVRAFDGAALGQALLAAWARLGPLAFVRRCVAPLVTATGLAWAAGELEIRHEHFVSERLSDLLRMLRHPFDERGAGPLVLFTTLPGELHVTGVQMAALVAAAAGCRVMPLGAETPVAEIAALTRDTGARGTARGGPRRTAAAGPYHAHHGSRRAARLGACRGA